MVSVLLLRFRNTTISPLLMSSLPETPAIKTRSPCFNAGHMEPDVIAAMGCCVLSFHERNLGIPMTIPAMMPRYRAHPAIERQSGFFFLGSLVFFRKNLIAVRTLGS